MFFRRFLQGFFCIIWPKKPSAPSKYKVYCLFTSKTPNIDKFIYIVLAVPNIWSMRGFNLLCVVVCNALQIILSFIIIICLCNILYHYFLLVLVCLYVHISCIWIYRPIKSTIMLSTYEKVVIFCREILVSKLFETKNLHTKKGKLDIEGYYFNSDKRNSVRTVTWYFWVFWFVWYF